MKRKVTIEVQDDLTAYVQIDGHDVGLLSPLDLGNATQRCTEREWRDVVEEVSGYLNSRALHGVEIEVDEDGEALRRAAEKAR